MSTILDHLNTPSACHVHKGFRFLYNYNTYVGFQYHVGFSLACITLILLTIIASESIYYKNECMVVHMHLRDNIILQLKHIERNLPLGAAGLYNNQLYPHFKDSGHSAN